jgi:hypothetical protein
METLMTIKTLSALAIVTAALSSPVFAQENTAPQKPVPALRHYGHTYNQVQEPAVVAPRAPLTGTNFDRSYDPSRIGGHDPDFNPPS